MLVSLDAAWLVPAALAFDAVLGDPDSVWRRWPHPVTWLGALVASLERGLNRETWPAPMRRAAGVAALAVLLATAVMAGVAIEALLHLLPFGGGLIALVASVFIAQRSLYDHVRRVREAFTSGGLAAARRAVSMIVGRDPDSLDEAGVCRAAIESCAENFSDGVVAPVFWFWLLGLPGLIAYKAANTADSMIGHRTPRHQAFGWAAARFDDLVNLVPARLSGSLIALVAPLVGGRPAAAIAAMWREARQHRSPNAGWPESAMAAALGIALAGPRRYGAETVDDPFLNPSGREATPNDIARALRVLVAACVMQAAVYAGLGLMA
ncbi:adenosylcobinamide-phosphate synthase CbiB [Xanthobacteraceae bacterium Astr-EGSB]|uniref:adenosylcobinamide-phosphate synthase CbiB n=1 Tax=Astrobacterium formosum TaxID=3069710 RepID=UPI0027B3BE06|nr:adenosylcobinamide-phosphate synthase CbiB [Xanthobacteraceae bacterium Astr-EGSB]